jgi:UDP-2-acetamido-3-amino-2,3-dideoxy-glucuronate N-acetyltransferase
VRTSLSLEGVFVYPHRLCESDDVGQETRVWAFAHVLARARIGRDCNVCDGALAANSASIGDVTVTDHVMIFESVHVADGDLLGPTSDVAIPETSSLAVVR